jgi:[glutamine synthetase] adenylyltransferase / [glutamine synthetase]-adenylyl-L-tyrosine phosphorylase
MYRELPTELVNECDSKWSDFQNALDTTGLSIGDDPEIETSMKWVFIFSDFVFKTCLRSPQTLVDLVESRDLKEPYDYGRYHTLLAERLFGVSDENSLGQKLRLFRQREMVRTAWRDLCGWADLPEIFNDLTGFAEACTAAALDRLFAWQCQDMGTPENLKGETQGLVVLAMGKLGGRELNFSSDIDLVFAFPEKGQTRGKKKPVENEEFFTRLGRRMISVLGNVTADGNLFRVDMRLRPFGENGPLVMSFDAMEDYYQQQGREWERYAWLRARVIAGDETAGKDLLGRLSPFIYRRYLDYTVLESLREMKHQIIQEVIRRDMENDIKLGLGGIREIEFFCQTFQILRGGITPVLKERHTPKLLEILRQENCIAPEVCTELLKAHVFLRNTEHRIQEFLDLRLHGIPSLPLDRLRLAVSMGFDDFDSYETELKHLREIVHGHFRNLLTSDKPPLTRPSSEDRLTSVWQASIPGPDARTLLTEAGYRQPDEVLTHLLDLKDSPETRALSAKGRERVDRLIPRLLAEATQAQEPDLVVCRIIDLIKAVQRRTSYIALILENHQVLAHLINLSGKSPWIIRFLALHPVVLDELLDPRTLYAPPERHALEKELCNQLSGISDEDLEYQIEALCVFKQVNTLRIAAADVAGALPLMRVSDHLTDLAETILEQTLHICRRSLVNRHGRPVCMIQSRPCDDGFLIVGYGKLGGIELGYRSDLDLIFLHAGNPEKTLGKDCPIETPYFFSRLGQQIVRLLTAHTRAGVVYEIDMRLRPSGNAGPLVIHIEAFNEYQKNEGWTWERQALVRARPVCGDPALSRRFLEIRESILTQPMDAGQLRTDVRSMRDKIRKERLKPEPDQFDLKEDRGGIIDIEFLAQYLVLRESHRCPDLTRWTDNIRILQSLSRTGVLDSETADTLRKAYLTFRAAVHQTNLEEKPVKVPAGRFQDLRAKVSDIFDVYLPPL